MNINPELLGQSLEIMGLGMAGIFIVLTVLLLSVKVLLKVFPEKKRNENSKVINTNNKEKVDTVTDNEEEELTAAIIAAISEEIKLPIDNFKVTNISEI